MHVKLCLQAIRKPEPEVPSNLAEAVEKVNGNLESLLQVVPEEDLDKGREVVEVLRSASNVLNKQQDEGSSSELTQEEEDVAKRLNGLIG